MPQLIRVSLDRLHSRGNVRTALGDLEVLASSFRDGQPEQPPVVHLNGTGEDYVIIFGHRRVEAARQAGATEMDVIVREPMDDSERIVLQLVENLHRQDLSPLDEAAAFNELLRQGKSQRQIAAIIGRSDAYISQRLALLTLSEQVQQALARGEISASVAESLTRLSHPEQLAALPRIKGKPVAQARVIMDQCQLNEAVTNQVRQRTRSTEDEYSALLSQGEDPLFIPALAELQAALRIVCDVYSGYRVSQSTGELRQRIRATAEQISATAADIAKCIQNQNGGNHNGE